MSITLPFALRSHHIFLDARVDGTPATLVLDTGSSMSTLDADWAHSVGLDRGTTTAKAVGTDSMSMFNLDSPELLEDRVKLNFHAIERIGDDLRILARFARTVVPGTDAVSPTVSK